MIRQGDGRTAIGRKKGLSITEDSTLRQQTEFGQRMRGRRFYRALVQEKPPVSFKESSLKKDEGLAIFSQGRNLGRKANFLTECNSFVLLLLTPFFVLFKGISWAVN